MSAAPGLQRVRHVRRATILALALPVLAGCGLFLTHRVGKDANGFEVYEPILAPPESPPHSLLIEGEVRDFTSFRTEPLAVIEAWTEDSEYKPKATVDERGHFGLLVELCRRETSWGESIAEHLVMGYSDGCARWIRKFHFRARLGDRCSLTYGADALPEKEFGTIVLWLRPCADSSR